MGGGVGRCKGRMGSVGSGRWLQGRVGVGRLQGLGHVEGW